MYQSLEEIISECKKNDLSFAQVVRTDDCQEEGISEEESFHRMKHIWQAMQEEEKNYDPSLKSSSGLVGTDAEKIRKRRLEGKLLSDDFTAIVMERALKVAESNACMKRIVAAPTAGSCGVVPAVLISMQEKYQYSDDVMTEAMYVAAGIGGVIAARACLAGAEGGCQAEIGSAAAMTSGASVFLLGGDAETICHAAAMALTSLMGLVCDPVAGLVEVPCVQRNVIGAMSAITSADMAMSGIRSRIPPDEVIDAMKSVGHQMANELRETGRGGLAATPAGQEIRKKIEGKF